MSSHYDVCLRWAERLCGSQQKTLQGKRIIADGDTIYSYGHHFPMGVALRDGDSLVGVLLNGDRYSVSTSRHQSELRGAVQRAGIPSVIIPFDALAAAGIDRKTIRVVDRTDDRTETRTHSTTQQPEGSVWRDDPVFEPQDRGEEWVTAYVQQQNEQRMQDWEQRHRWAREDLGSTARNGTYWQRWVEERSVAEYPLEFTADLIPVYQRTHIVQVGTVRRLYTSSTGHNVISVEEIDGVTHYSWSTTRHWLGESLIRALVPVQKAIKCSGCKGRGWIASCVICQTDGRQHRRINIDSKPAPCGKPGIHRQHYVEPYRAMHERGYWCDGTPGNECPAWDRNEERRCQSCVGSGRRFIDKSRTALFLSGFDRNERRRSYFFCELPQSALGCTTIEEAYEALKPDAVRLAEQMGRPVHRQGDIFAIHLPGVTRRALTKQGAHYEKRGPLLGTNHVGSQVAYLPDGTTLVAGSLIHDPGFRRADHARVRLGGSTSWWVVVKNTVPISR